MRYLFILLLSTVVLSSGCKDEACPEGYEGTDCNIAVFPKSIIIKSVTAIRWPFSSDWDAFSNPDPYIAIYDNNGNELGRTTSITNTITNPLAWTNVNVVLDAPGEKEYLIRIIDEDDITDDMVMGGYTWVPGTHATLNNFPITVDLDVATSETSFSLTVEYNF